MPFRIGLTLVWAALLAHAQLATSPQAIARTGKPPVVFLNGYQDACAGATFAGTFGIADQVLASNGYATVFFNNCSVTGKPPIERLAAEFGAFLDGLRYTDGGAVDRVDAVGHSMGGLIIRAYLSGKQEQAFTFAPPPAPRIRKAVFLATPHFGTPIANLQDNAQTRELANGSTFLWDLNTWNNNTDDLRGIDALAAAGNAGVGFGGDRNFDDGVVSLTSASIEFYAPGRTRVLPACHTGGLAALLCAPGSKLIARIDSAGDDSARLLVSFLNGTDEWRSIGQAASQDPYLSANGGIFARPFTAGGEPQTLRSASIAPPGGPARALSLKDGQIAFTERYAAGAAAIAADTTVTENITQSVTVAAGTGQTFSLKPGPIAVRVIPSAAVPVPLTVAPRTIIAIYGTALSPGTQQAPSVPLPDSFGATEVVVNGARLPLYFVSPGQINAVLPPELEPGLAQLTVRNAAGASRINVLVEPSRPAVYTANSSGSGLASALLNGAPVGPQNVPRAGDWVSIFLTGLGRTERIGDLDWAVITPTVTIGGVACPINYAGAAPGFPGLDQINCQIPAGLRPDAAAPLVVTSGGRISAGATLPVE